MDLPPNATAEEVENEILVYHVLMDSLDPFDEDYESKKLDIERPRQVLEARLEQLLGGGQSSQSVTTPRSSTSRALDFDLPSREKDARLTNGRDESLLVGRPTARPSDLIRSPHLAVPGRSLASSSASSNHDGPSKRRREGWSFDHLDETTNTKRSKLNDGNHTVSAASTPATIDSLDEGLAALDVAHRVNITSTSNTVMKKMLEQQKQAEMRIKREQEDAEFARQLEAFDRPSAATVPAQHFPRYQATVNSNGQIRRAPPPQPVPAPAALPPPPAFTAPTPSQSVVGHRPVVNQEVGHWPEPALSGRERAEFLLQQRYGQASEQQNQALQAKQEAETTACLHALTGLDSSDDDAFAEITPAQFTASVSPRSRANGVPPFISGVMPNLNPTSNSFSPNSYISPSAIQNSYTGYGYVPPSAHNPMIGPHNPMIGGSSVYGPPSASQSALDVALRGIRSTASHAGRLWDAINGAADIIGTYSSGPGNPGVPAFIPGTRSVPTGYVGTSAFANPHPALTSTQGLGVGGLAYPRGYGFEDEDGSDDDIEILRSRVFDPFAVYDPAKTRDELEQLLDNIRPDEDIPPEKRDQPIELKCKLHEHQKLGLAWLKQMEEGSNKGGILADDMGLGKTIQALALIVARPSEDLARRTTLILTPVALMHQWAQEIKDQLHSQYKLSVFIFHGQQKKVSFATLSNYDVVITTYGKLANEYKVKSALEARRVANPGASLRPSERLTLIGDECRWYRIILDEAQCIKNKNTKTAMGSCHLNATYRLCMSGTPMMNSVLELFSLIRFLGIRPYNSHERFQKDFKVLTQNTQHGRERAMQQFQALLKAILLRRTKKSTVDGKPILQLPERTTEIVHAVFDEEEKAVYNALETETQLQVNRYLEEGRIGRNYSYILVRLLRLRQACCHPHLIKDFAEDGPGDIPVEDMRKLAGMLDQSVITRLKDTEGNFECPICMDAAENPTIFFPCGHNVCTECFARMIDPANAVAGGSADGSVSAKCPQCRGVVDPKKILNWTSFKQAHMLEGEGEAEDDIAVKDEESDAGSDSDSDDGDDDDDSDGDLQGDLRDFIVDDDNVDYDEDATEDEEEIKAERRLSVKPEPKDDDDDFDPEDLDDAPRKPARKVASKASFKGKGKAPADPKKKPSSKSRSKAKGKGKGKKKQKKTLADLKKESMKNAKAKRRYLRRLRKNFIPSAKLLKTIEILRAIRDRGEGEKTLIFSQFTSLLDLLEVAFDDEFRYRRYDGSMSAKARDDAVQDFKNKNDVTVMLVSLKAGNAGLNLTAASQVIILDPFWNPFVEEQAIDRAHRLGQNREVMVHKVLVEGTVEDRIIELQEKKRKQITEALDEKAGQSVSRLGRAELAFLFNLNRS